MDTRCSACLQMHITLINTITVSDLICDFSLTASGYQRTFIRRHQHNSLYSINNFKRWPEEPVRFQHPLYRGRRDRTEHKRKRQWSPRKVAQPPRDENTWLMLVWKEEKGSQEKSTRENSSKKPRGQHAVFLHFGGRWNLMKCLLERCWYMTFLIKGHCCITLPTWMK